MSPIGEVEIKSYRKTRYTAVAVNLDPPSKFESMIELLKEKIVRLVLNNSVSMRYLYDQLYHE